MNADLKMYGNADSVCNDLIYFDSIRDRPCCFDVVMGWDVCPPFYVLVLFA